MTVTKSLCVFIRQVRFSPKVLLMSSLCADSSTNHSATEAQCCWKAQAAYRGQWSVFICSSNSLIDALLSCSLILQMKTTQKCIAPPAHSVQSRRKWPVRTLLDDCSKSPRGTLMAYAPWWRCLCFVCCRWRERSFVQRADGHQYITNATPDMCVLQETKCGAKDLPKEFRYADGYNTYFQVCYKADFIKIFFVRRRHPLAGVMQV